MGFINSQRINSRIRYSGAGATWPEVTGHGFIDESHSATGPILFLINLTVNYDFKIPGLNRSDIGGRLVEAALSMAKKSNISLVEGITRLNGMRGELTRSPDWKPGTEDVDAYLERVKKKEIRDPALSFHLEKGAVIEGPVENAMPDDEESFEWGALIVYHVA